MLVLTGARWRLAGRGLKFDWQRGPTLPDRDGCVDVKAADGAARPPREMFGSSSKATSESEGDNPLGRNIVGTTIARVAHQEYRQHLSKRRR